VYFSQACEKYELVSKTLAEPDDSLHNDWGRVLYELAKVRDGAETERLLTESCKQYELATQIDVVRVDWPRITFVGGSVCITCDHTEELGRFFIRVVAMQERCH
jgi:hypothetical protein